MKMTRHCQLEVVSMAQRGCAVFAEEQHSCRLLVGMTPVLRVAEGDNDVIFAADIPGHDIQVTPSCKCANKPNWHLTSVGAEVTDQDNARRLCAAKGGTCTIGFPTGIECIFPANE